MSVVRSEKEVGSLICHFVFEAYTILKLVNIEGAGGL